MLHHHSCHIKHGVFELDFVPEALLTYERASLRLEGANKEALRMLCLERDELRALRMSDLLPHLDPSILKSAIADRSETRCRARDGRELDADVRLAEMPDGRAIAVLRDITHHAEVEAQLKTTNTFLDAIVENIPDMIFVKRAEDLMFVRFNRAGEELLGWKRSELIGKTDHDFYPKEEADFFHQKDRETLRGQTLVDIPEEPIHTKANGLRWLHTRKVPVNDERGVPRYLLGISEDITARKEMEERAHALERELASLVLNAHDAIIAWDPSGTIISWNPAAEVLYGVSASTAIGSSIEALIPEQAKPSFRASCKRVLAGERLTPAEVVRLRGGVEIEVQEGLFAIPASGDRGPRLASISRDRTEIARLRRAAEILSGADRTAANSGETRSPAMREVLSIAEVVAKDPIATVLLLGETGVGKSWLARRVHAASPRAKRPFFEINCASLGHDLTESELFGHERGAFTGAIGQKRGLVEAAEGGTLFLDEVGELSASAQAQLLTFLDTRTFRRVGGVRSLSADVRILAATNVDLREAAERGQFRRDLYYRLSVVPLTVPPLRERREDLFGLARGILRERARGALDPETPLDRRVLSALESYDWPGNVRELRNTLERALILSGGGAIELEHLPKEVRERHPRNVEVRLSSVADHHIQRVLTETNGNRTRAAEILGISRSTLKRRLARR